MASKANEIEIDIRGSVLKISTTFESSIMSIIYFSNEEQFYQKDSPNVKLKGCMFGQKIERLEKILNQFHPDLLAEYNTLLSHLKEFKIFRNRFAHCIIHFTDPKCRYFYLWDISEDESKRQFYEPIKFSVVEVTKNVIVWIDKISHPLMKLRDEVELRLEQSAPKLFLQLTQEYNYPESK